MVTTAEARAPRGLRLYVVGDVHGCEDLLDEVHGRIDDDLVRRPAEDWRLIHLGDYIDRGPDSRGVIERAIARLARGRSCYLRGNHEQFLIDLILDPEGEGAGLWLANGGAQTLASYGIAADSLTVEGAALHRRALEAIPAAHQQFLLGLPHLVRFGDYAFAHAGIRPGVPLAEQQVHDLIWLREPFLSDPRDHGPVVVHGHTPVPAVDVRANRINIDTGAVFGGDLTCLVLENAEKALLGPAGPVPLGLSPTT